MMRHRLLFSVLSLAVLGLAALPASGPAQAVSQKPPEESGPPAHMQTGSAIYMEKAFKAFDAHLAACSASSGYDPDKAADLGTYEIASGEAAWATCAYEGVDKILVPESRTPELYRDLVARHKDLTAQLRDQKVTRAERRALMETMVLKIQFLEARVLSDAELEALRESATEDDDWVRRQVDSLRGFK